MLLLCLRLPLQAAQPPLTPNSTGYLKPAATANDRIVAIALEACAVAGNIHPVFVLPSNL